MTLDRTFRAKRKEPNAMLGNLKLLKEVKNI
jgi:hypothetical protein